MFQIDDRRFNRLALLGLAAGFLLLIAAFAAAITTFALNQSSAERVRHTYKVVDQLSQLETQLERAEAGRRGYLLAQSPYRLDVYRINAALTPQTLDGLAAMVADNPDQVRLIAPLRTLVERQLSELSTSIGLARSGRTAEARRQFEAGSAATTIRRIRTLTADLRRAEYALLDERSEREQASLSAVQLVLAFTGLMLLLVGAGSFWLVRRYTKDLTAARDRLHLLNTDLEGAVRARTAQLQRANEEIQRFAYIVSHDLRSPLVNIMGFTAELQTASEQLSQTFERIQGLQPDLLDAPARLAIKEDLPEAVGFIRSSTQKMDRLINAILRLSREGRRSLNPDHLLMDRVVAEIIASFEQQLAAKGARVSIAGRLPDLHSDRVAVEQILSNLVENAIKYGRSDGTAEIRIEGQRNGGEVTFAVSDNGRGVAPGDHDRIFDLFRRSGAQDQPGEGLGLAHARALAYRLGGTVTIDSALGEGSTFRLILPVTYSDREASA
jgi:signal transduction histidine kinase